MVLVLLLTAALRGASVVVAAGVVRVDGVAGVATASVVLPVAGGCKSAARCWASCLAAALVAALAVVVVVVAWLRVLRRLRAGLAAAVAGAAVVTVVSSWSSPRSITGDEVLVAAVRTGALAVTLKASLATRAARLVGAGGSGISGSVLVFRAVKNTKPLDRSPSGFGGKRFARQVEYAQRHGTDYACMDACQCGSAMKVVLRQPFWQPS